MREWLESDRDAFAEMNADEHVMRFFPGRLTREESDSFFDRIQRHHAIHGFGLLVIADEVTGSFAGFCGLSVPAWEAPFTPCVEVGWRVRREYQNRGWATAAARLSLSDAFTRLALEEVVSFTVPQNLASRRVMEKLGMAHNSRDDFDHPRLQSGNPLRRHVLYRLKRGDWLAAQNPKPKETP